MCDKKKAVFSYVLITRYEKSKRKIFTAYQVRIKLSWKVKVMRAIVSQVPRKIQLSWNRHMRSAIGQQLTTKDK